MANGARSTVAVNFSNDFLSDLDPRNWSKPKDYGGSIATSCFFLGSGDHPLEVAVGTSSGRPKADEVRALWKIRQAHRPSPVLLVVGYDSGGDMKVSVCGPVGETPPLVADLDPSQIERLAGAALKEPSRHAAVRLLVAMLPEVGSDLPGLRNSGLLATQELRVGVPTRTDWASACEKGKAVLALRGRKLVENLGFKVEQLGITSSVLVAGSTKRAVAVFLDEGESFDEPGKRFDTSPVSQALALADREGLPWVVLTRSQQVRLYAARPDTGVGRKGRAETFVEADLALLPQDKAGFIPLLFGAGALAEDGTIEEILERSADFAADLGARLRERVYFDVVPRLATCVAHHVHGGRELSEQELADAYEETLVVLFRLLFVAYGEDKDLLPYRTNGRYEDHSLKRMARRLTEWKGSGDDIFDPHATDLWDDVRALWSAVNEGNSDWGVPPYDGGLFSENGDVNPAGAALSGLSLSNAEFGPALTSLVVDEGPDGLGPVDFRSLSVREFGTIYEGLLESRLSVAPSNLAIVNGDYVPTKSKVNVAVAEGEVYFHHRSGSRKSTGSYFTKPFAVEHLLDHALEPAIADHIKRVETLLKSGDDAAASQAFFDFRCADLAMGSGHFLVAAVDRIEARLSGFLALHPVPGVLAELDSLRLAAMTALGELSDGVEIETTTLLRRQVARRCIYGVDRNRIAVELARLAIWIHTFVPGLPLSFLDHNLIEGDSLTGIGTMDEALLVLDPEAERAGQLSVFRAKIEEFLGRAEKALRRLAVTSEATIREVSEAREANAEAIAAVQPARDLFDILVAARLGHTVVPIEVDEDKIARHSGLSEARVLREHLGSVHFPVAFPEVFLRERPGFDCILGNPPWEEVMVDESTFWALRSPGIRSMTAGEMKKEISRLKRHRPDWLAEYGTEVEAMDERRELLSCGQYPQMNEGNADFYKAFCWRFWQLDRDGGAIGVVLPRTALSGAGSRVWRQTILEGGAFEDVTLILNNTSWAFGDVHPQYTFGLVSIRKGVERVGLLRLRGPYPNLASFRRGVVSKPAEFSVADFMTWSDGLSFPLLPTARSAEVFAKLRRQPRLDAKVGWRARPVQGDFNATTDKHYFDLDLDDPAEGMWPVYKGASFNIWEPDTGTYYAWADPDEITEVLQTKRLKQQRNAKSAFSEFDRDSVSDPETLPCWYPRIAFRDVTNRTNSRTVIAALVPGFIVITNQAPYLLWPEGDERDEAYMLGVLCSIPFDWYARRVVETHVNFHLFNAFPIPRPGRGDPLRRRVEQIAGRLASVDAAYSEWAMVVGVKVGKLKADEKQELIAELDAAVALLYELDASDITHIFETFHTGWDYGERLQSVLGHYERLSRGG